MILYFISELESKHKKIINKNHMLIYKTFYKNF